MFAIRNLAVREGNVPAGVVAQAKSLLDTGRVVNPVRTTIMEREREGLAEITLPVEEVQKILKRTGFEKKMGLK